MRPLTTIELLNVWEIGLNSSLIEKSLRLLSIACSKNLSDIATLSIGQRDTKLLQLREWMFGNRLHNIAHCPMCSTLVEWETDLKALYLQSPSPGGVKNEYNLKVDEFNLRFRLLNSNDLLKAASGNDSFDNSKKLLAKCIFQVQHEDQDYQADALPDNVWESLHQRIGQEDPQADIQMVVNCPACLHTWEAPFDIISYLWVEIDNWARHQLQEVYVLARAFSWSESDILSMSTQRRQFYLEMIRS